jgi:hypothetical protein
VQYETVENLRERHASWRLLRASNASLILSFLGDFFVSGNRGATSATEIATALDDHLFDLNAALGDADSPARYPKAPREYLEDWSATEAGYLRRFYPPGDDEVFYEITPAFEKAYAWVTSLQGRPFVGTASRLHTVVDLLRQIVHGTETDPQRRLEDLQRQRAEIDVQIAAVQAGEVPVLDGTGVRDRYQQLSTTARELLSDFREVEENFRLLDRSARERIAAWDGSKGELLSELIGTRSQITGSDQGRSFQAFYEFLLSETRQQELTDLLQKVSGLSDLEADPRIRGIHHDWSEAAERAQRTVRQISEQLRRFLDDQVWLENRRVIDLVRGVKACALDVRTHPPAFGLTVDVPGIPVILPFDRPLYHAPATVTVDSEITTATEEVDSEVLFTQAFIDRVRLAQNIREALPENSSALLSDIVAIHPIEQGAAEIVGYLALTDDDVEIDMTDDGETLLDYPSPNDPETVMRARMPRVTVRRR